LRAVLAVVLARCIAANAFDAAVRGARYHLRPRAESSAARDSRDECPRGVKEGLRRTRWALVRCMRGGLARRWVGVMPTAEMA